MIQDSLPYGIGGDARERDVLSMLHVVDEFGSATERFFDRLYRALSRKQSRQYQSRPDPDQLTALVGVTL